MENPIRSFYEAFQALDAEGMAACYHPEVRFEDPAFGVLQGEHAANMWRMLCASQSGKDFRLTYSDIVCTDTSGSARWEAQYNFSKTGRRVHNRIQATFELRDGLILRHTDRFSLHRWAGQALGTTGRLLGWTSFFRQKLQRQTNRLLANYEQEHTQPSRQEP